MLEESSKLLQTMLEVHQTTSILARAYVEKQWKSIKLSKTGSANTTKTKQPAQKQPSKKISPSRRRDKTASLPTLPSRSKDSHNT
jgi:hypothetical protein